ncbi:uncharacterized protein HMPREF1541_08111 [Cyphellophora europaea CBS 101466]|uniref:Uncharacterized protein n=1 Tax=Cyphellophora europaea (strain CBS 101466) TaxID=1220924 RepID=W2RKV6_CYPE1|nr:uncharacterized protein HMPREF1541_08111 [Cyphellophora europaea CBS 101466]ETN37121.1 hypothetical protein HMPREF1541_08111 [Cyphellophora europaea CBS 101466]
MWTFQCIGIFVLLVVLTPANCVPFGAVDDHDPQLVHDHTNNLHRRQCTKDATDTGNRGYGDADHHVSFWTNLGEDTKTSGKLMMAWFKSRGEGGKIAWLHRCVDNSSQEGYVRTLTQQGREPLHWNEWDIAPHLVLVRCIYQALALAAVNPDVYLFTRSDQDGWPLDSLWEQYEFWALTRNPNVQRVWQVDPRNPESVEGLEPEEMCQFNDRHVIWERGKDAELPMKMTCPVFYPGEGEPWESWTATGVMVAAGP